MFILKFKKPHKLSSTVPLLNLLHDHIEYTEIENQYFEIYKTYRNKIEDLTSKLKELFNEDPVLDALKPIFQNCCFTTIDKNTVELIKEAKERSENKIPPLCGGDSTKKYNMYGDYFIWKDILSIDNDVIFVSSDFKEDWYYLDNHDKPISPRRELLEEFYEVSNGKTCCFASISDFIKTSSPGTSISVLEDLSSNLIEINDVLKEYQFKIQYKTRINGVNKIISEDIFHFLDSHFIISDFSYGPALLDLYTNKYEYVYIKFRTTSKINIDTAFMEFKKLSRNDTYVFSGYKSIVLNNTSDFIAI